MSRDLKALRELLTKAEFDAIDAFLSSDEKAELDADLAAMATKRRRAEVESRNLRMP